MVYDMTKWLSRRAWLATTHFHAEEKDHGKPKPPTDRAADRGATRAQVALRATQSNFCPPQAGGEIAAVRQNNRTTMLSPQYHFILGRWHYCGESFGFAQDKLRRALGDP